MSHFQQRWWITGTDTHVGKTTASGYLLRYLKSQGYSTIGLKPVCSGGTEDIEHLQLFATHPLTTETSFCFEPPIAPHLAAEKAHVLLSVESLQHRCQKALQTSVDIAVIEGAGGFLVPINATETLADFALSLKAGVILVVGLRLGCLNHALLSQMAILQSGCPFLGWIANRIDPDFDYWEDNLDALKQRLIAPLLGTIPYQPPETILAFNLHNLL